MKRTYIIILILSLVGILDASYLTFEHFANTIPPCSVNPVLGDCGRVLRSEYSTLFGIPLALIGVFHYSFLLGTLVFQQKKNLLLYRLGTVVLSTIGFISSSIFVYIQLAVIHAICVYCMVSAVTSIFLFILSLFVYKEEWKFLWSYILGVLYRLFLKPLFFLVEPEVIHESMSYTGEILGTIPPVKQIMASMFVSNYRSLNQELSGIRFKTPIGLAAGFDYEARLTQIVPSLGFGFESVGTITNHPYEGNPRPRLGRLPNSYSLMVNKGFKNMGAKKTIKKLTNHNFDIPIGISIGRTNSIKLTNVKESIADITSAFTIFEKANLEHSYYELNISCPNLYGDVSFYPKKNLDTLLSELDKLHITRPLFVKMPIEKNDKDVLDMLDSIARHSPAGVIFGNLQKDRNHPLLRPAEVAKFPIGNFSGKPTFERSNQLIKLSYKYFKTRLDIIGCGGVFNADDAYEKITLGASLVQLITGMIFMGPQVISEINRGLVYKLQKDGFTHISQAVGSRNT